MTQLDDYISKARVAGLDDDAIKNELRKAGWDEATISANFQLPQSMPSVATGSMPESLPAQFREHFTRPSIWRKIKIPVIVFCLLIAVGAGAYFGYNYYFNSNSNLLAEALQKTFTANSGHMSFQMSVADKIEKGDDMNDLSQIFGDNLAVNIKGDADYKLSTQKTMDVDGDFEASFNVGGFNVGVNVSVKVIGEDTYVHLGDNPLLQMFTGLDSSESSKWFKLNTKELEAMAEEGGELPANESAINKVQNLFQKGEFISLGKNLGSEKIDDINTTHYQLIINKDNLKKTIGETVELFATESGAPSGEAQEAVQIVSLFIDKADLTADIWISSDKYVRKLVYDFKLPSLTQVTEIYDETYGDVEDPDFEKRYQKSSQRLISRLILL